MLDLVIRGGVLYDGTGAPPRAGDLATRDGRIVSVGDPVPLGGAVEEFDAAGLAVIPTVPTELFSLAICITRPASVLSLTLITAQELPATPVANPVSTFELTA